MNVSRTEQKDEQIIRFMPIGDSYTIGNGVKIEERWPNLLVDSLKKENIPIELIRNPAVSGYDARDALDKEIEKFERDKPDLGTLFIGANDAFRRRPLDQFRKEYIELIERMQATLPNKNRLVIITIPNYAQFPAGKEYVSESELIEQYNRIIREEASNRGLEIVDLYLVEMLNSDDYFIKDGIHPNARGIQIWHDAILPVIKKVLKN